MFNIKQAMNEEKGILGYGFNSVEQKPTRQAILWEQKTEKKEESKKTEAPKKEEKAIEILVLDNTLYDKDKHKGKMCILYAKSGDKIIWHIGFNGERFSLDVVDPKDWWANEELEKKVKAAVDKTAKEKVGTGIENILKDDEKETLRKVMFLIYMLVFQNTPAATSSSTSTSTPTATKPTDKKETSSASKTTTPKPSTTKTMISPSREVKGSVQLFTSLSEFSSNLTVKTSIGMLGFDELAKIGFKDIQKHSAQELYYVLKVQCIEHVQSLMAPYVLDKTVTETLASPDGNKEDFFRAYGDSVIDTVTYGRYAYFIIQFKLASLEHQNRLSEKLGLPILPGDPLSVNVDTKFILKLQEKISKERYTIYFYTGGLDYLGSGVLADVAAMGNLIGKISLDGQKTSPAQIGLTYKSYEMFVEKNALKMASEVNHFITVAVKLSLLATQCSEAVDTYLDALNQEHMDPIILHNFPLGSVSVPVGELKGLMADLIKIKKRIDDLQKEIAVCCFNIDRLKAIEEDINECLLTLHNYHDKVLSVKEIPVKRIPGDNIQDVTHRRGEFSFGIQLPEGCDTLKMRIVDDEGKAISLSETPDLFDEEIKSAKEKLNQAKKAASDSQDALKNEKDAKEKKKKKEQAKNTKKEHEKAQKEYKEIDDKHYEKTVIKLKQKSIPKHAFGDKSELGKIITLGKIRKGRKESRAIAVPGKLTRLYLKPKNKKWGPAFFPPELNVDIYCGRPPTVLNTLPERSQVTIMSFFLPERPNWGDFRPSSTGGGSGGGTVPQPSTSGYGQVGLCFDIATGLDKITIQGLTGRKALVHYALGQADQEEYRKLLAPEIKTFVLAPDDREKKLLANFIQKNTVLKNINKEYDEADRGLRDLVSSRNEEWRQDEVTLWGRKPLNQVVKFSLNDVPKEDQFNDSTLFYFVYQIKKSGWFIVHKENDKVEENEINKPKPLLLVLVSKDAVLRGKKIQYGADVSKAISLANENRVVVKKEQGAHYYVYCETKCQFIKLRKAETIQKLNVEFQGLTTVGTTREWKIDGSSSSQEDKAAYSDILSNGECFHEVVGLVLDELFPDRSQIGPKIKAIETAADLLPYKEQLTTLLTQGMNKKIKTLKELQGLLSDTNLNNTHPKLANNRNQKKTDLDQASAAMDDVEKKFEDKVVYESYVQDYYGQGNWFAYGGADATSMVEIVALMMNAVITICDAKGEKVLHTTEGKVTLLLIAQQGINIHYNGKNHFWKMEGPLPEKKQGLSPS